MDFGIRLLQEINLIPNGSNISVTNENKRNYLNRLAQYRLSESIRPEIEQFIKGKTACLLQNTSQEYECSCDIAYCRR